MNPIHAVSHVSSKKTDPQPIALQGGASKEKDEQSNGSRKFISKESSGFFKKDSNASGSSKKSSGVNSKKGSEKLIERKDQEGYGNIFTIPEKSPKIYSTKVELQKPQTKELNRDVYEPSLQASNLRYSGVRDKNEAVKVELPRPQQKEVGK